MNRKGVKALSGLEHDFLTPTSSQYTIAILKNHFMCLGEEETIFDCYEKEFEENYKCDPKRDFAAIKCQDDAHDHDHDHDHEQDHDHEHNHNPDHDHEHDNNHNHEHAPYHDHHR